VVANQTEEDFSLSRGLVPRYLLGEGIPVSEISTTDEGLCPVSIACSNGKLEEIKPLKESPEEISTIVLPRFVETHAHLDKAFTWRKTPNFAGTYEGALKANFEEHKYRNKDDLYTRADKALNLAFKNGYRAIRTHIDSYGIQAEISWEILLTLQKEWVDKIQLQLVALVPIEYWTTGEGQLFAARVSSLGGLLGGVVLPPFQMEIVRNQLEKLIKLANKLNCGIDLHIDESQEYPAFGLQQLVEALDRIDSCVPITCSHSSSMSLLDDEDLNKLADRLAFHRVNVIALPLTNSWLLGRRENKSPLIRPLAPIIQLQNAGVNVAIGGDNVGDPWYPIGNFDPLALMASSLPIAQVVPWDNFGLSLFTNAPAKLMQLDWDGKLKKGMRADFILIEADSWTKALSKLPSREVIVAGRKHPKNSYDY
tara:strand:+ start:6158 stop:7429 length:1272 start_codon:yes stop_codon:yes gene_type:complete